MDFDINQGTDLKSIKKANIRMVFLFHIAVLLIIFRLIYGISGYLRLISGVLPGILLSASFFCKRSLPVKYVLSTAAFALMICVMIISGFGFEDISYFIFVIPALYAYLLPDEFSPCAAGVILAGLIFKDNNPDIPYKVVVAIAAGAVSNGLLLSFVSHVMRRFIRERNKYKELSSDLQEANEQLQYGVLHDSLTGLPNRNYIMNELANAIKRKSQYVNYLFAVAFIDLDRFKVINDSLGHNYGDKLLIEVSKRLKLSVRSNDTVARLGGDEFVLFLDGIKDSRDAEHIVERVLEEVKKPFNVSGHEISTSASIGIVLSNNEYEMPGEYLRYADITMYRAKTLGKSRYEIYDPAVGQNVIKNIRLEADLRYAIERNELQLNYQPIFSLHTQEILGFEALLRWRHPELGVISPSDFIPMAEETGLIVPIGKWVLYEACKQISKWQRNTGGRLPLTVNVNLSPIQLSQLEIASDIGEVLRSTGVNPGSLHIEVTESALIKDIQISQYMLEQIKNLGVRIYIDDFGTGYSSLSYLNQFPFDAVKIDRSFVQQLKGSSGLLKSIIHMAHEMNMSVIGEGIESLEQMKRLNEFGCECGQGFYFSKPVDSQTVEKMLNRYTEEICQPRMENGIILLG